MCTLLLKFEFCLISFILFFFLYKLSQQYVMSNEHDYPEYREKLREYIGYNNKTIPPKTLENIQSSPPTISDDTQNNIGLAASFNPEKNITILDFWSMGQVENVQFPSPCKELPSSGTSVAQNIYCISLIALWLLLITSTLIYQIRKLVILRNSTKKNREIELKVIERKDTNSVVIPFFKENGHFANREDFATK